MGAGEGWPSRPGPCTEYVIEAVEGSNCRPSTAGDRTATGQRGRSEISAVERYECRAIGVSGCATQVPADGLFKMAAEAQL